ncbi:MAG TPA: enoyl-CoA hydratase-related protein [Acidimicrobiales bacterium]|nr:enoyl-CoA hydratase-related protein [Acidimicrobiales bacterium]
MGDIRVERQQGNVAVVTVSAPETRNALTPEMGRQLDDVCDDLDRDQHLGAVVVRGEGGTFCSGADTRTWDVNADPASDEAFVRTSATYGAFARVGTLRVPTIAAVRGAAVGAGINLALATDLRIVATDVRLLAGFLRIGIHPGGGFFTLAGRLGGRETAAALGLFSQEISGERAVALGLAWEAHPDAEVEPRALELARAAGSDPELARRAVSSFRTELGPPGTSWPAALELERGVQMWSQRRRATDAGQAGT